MNNTLNNTLNNALKPCPFCGSKPFVWRTNHRTYIECPNLTTDSHRVMMCGKTDKEAIEAWNRRNNNGCHGEDWMPLPNPPKGE